MPYVIIFNKMMLNCFCLNFIYLLYNKNRSLYCIFRSNLAAIFGIQSKLVDPQSIKQTAPKKNKILENTRYNIQQTVPSSKTEILIAKAIHAFKL